MRRLVLLAVAVVVGCGSGAPSDPGLDARLRIEGAVFYPGPLPAPNGGPNVVVANVSSNQIAANSDDRSLDGSLDATATAALVELSSDPGYWVLPAGLADVNAPGFPTFHGQLGFSAELSPGDYTLRVEAADAEGRYGVPTIISLHAVPPDLPDGTLVVQLAWDTEADLDLHVVTPDHTEIFARDINSLPLPKPGRPVDPRAFESGGLLDFDSNAGCVIDGRRRENVLWKVAPPAGPYLVRVDTFSLCQADAARWDVTAVLGGRVLGHARGASGPVDAQGPHDRGAGVLALSFDVP